MKNSDKNILINTKLKKSERIIFKIFKPTFMKVYNIGRINGVNSSIN